MSFPVANVNISQDTFSVWVTRTNQLLDALSRYTVTVDNAGSNVTVGSGYVTGTFGGNTIVATQGIRGGNTSVSSNLTLISNTTVLGILRANSSVIVSNTLNVGGTATLSANLSVQGNTNISNTLIISGNTSIGGRLSVSGNTNISNTLIVTGNTTINGLLNVTGNTNISNTLNVTGNTNISGSFSFTGSNLVFSSNVTFSNTAGIIANGSLGANGTVLFSNGSGLYWDSITIPTIIGNTGIISNTSGLFVDPSYIATISANSATFANSSSTNTFTIGTASYFVSNGNFGIGNTSPSHKLRVEGDISTLGDVSATNFNSLSDISKKINVKELKNSIETIMLLRPVEFEWVSNGNKSMGVIAQDLEKIIPELVQEDTNKTKTVNYIGIIAYLIGAIQEQQLQIEYLKSKI